MSGNANQRNRSAPGRSDSRNRYKNVASQMEWRPKTKIATDGSLGNASCTSGKMSSSSGKPASGVALQQECLLPLVEDVASGVEILELKQSSCQKVDDDVQHLGSVSSSDYKLKDSTLSSGSEPSYEHSSASKGQTGRRPDMVAENHDNCSSIVNMPAMITNHPPADCFSLEDGVPEKGTQVGDGSQGKAGSRFDICPKRSNPIVKLKSPLHVKNKEKRNQIKRAMEGQNILVLRPGMVLMKGYISSNNQTSIVKACRELGIGDGGFYQPGYRDGSTLHLKMMCLGKNWDPESSKYGDIRPFDNTKPPGIPDKFHDMVKRAIEDSNAYIQEKFAKTDAGSIIPSMSPDVCIVNFYTRGGKLGLHQDKDESAESLNRGLPVVSFSIGDSAEFLYGETRDVEKADKVVLESGDVLIFGGKSRRIFHGVASVVPDTAPTSLVEATDVCPGRLNLTFRQF